MPLSGDTRTAIGYLAPGAVAGVAAFAFSRVMIEPLIGAAVDYEGAREHAEAQLARRRRSRPRPRAVYPWAVQENVGAAVGVIAFGIAMGVLFALAYTVIRGVLGRRRFPARGWCVDIAGRGGDVRRHRLGARVEVSGKPADGRAGGHHRRAEFGDPDDDGPIGRGRGGGPGGRAGPGAAVGTWRATGVAVAGYAAVILIAMTLLPNFHEVPGPIDGPDGL